MLTQFMKMKIHTTAVGFAMEAFFINILKKVQEIRATIQKSRTQISLKRVLTFFEDAFGKYFQIKKKITPFLIL